MANISLVCILLLCFSQIVKTDYILCSGYVNTIETESSVRPDLSKIKIAMYRDGVLKDTVTCNPDGSFIVSVDEGQSSPFSLEVKAPADAAFDPSVQIIHPNENITLCDAKINFVFLGFSISSQVIGKYSTIGPIGFPVELALADGRVVKSTQTDKDGHYKFDNVYPGNYTIKAAATNDFIVDKTSQSFACKIDWSLTEDCANNNLIVSGYHIKGTVGKHLVGVTLAIYSKNKRIADELITDKARGLASELPKVDGYYLLDVQEIAKAVFVL